MEKIHNTFYIHSKEPLAQIKLNKIFHELVANIDKPFEKVAVVCIGTDHSTGDSFGPLVGYFLSRYKRVFSYDVYGTIYDPVHALNLEETLLNIDTSNTLVIAVDSALGKAENVGCITTGYSPIFPGRAVGKSLPPVGDIHLSGIVNMSNALPFLLLQCTSLGLVYHMAQMAAWTVIYACSQSPLKEKIYTYKRQVISPSL